jgi:hypothetical protein
VKTGNDSITSTNSDIFFPSMPDDTNSSKSNADETQSKKIGHYYKYFYMKVNASVRSLVLSELKHYSIYSINVKACRDGPGPDNCSNEAIATQRTMKIANSDDITTFNVLLESTNKSLSAVRIIWASPERPNGLIISYSIKYKKVLENSKSSIECNFEKSFKTKMKTHSFSLFSNFRFYQQEVLKYEWLIFAGGP